MFRLYSQFIPATNTKIETVVVSAHSGIGARLYTRRNGQLVHFRDVKPGELGSLVLLKAGVKHAVAIRMGR